MKNRAPPLLPRKAPKMMKVMTKVADTPRATPKIPSGVRYMCWMMRLTE